MSHRSLGSAVLALGFALVVPAAVSAQTAGGGTPVMTSQGALAAPIPAPTRIATAPGGRLYVTDSKGGFWMLTPRGEVMAKVSLPERAVAVAASATEVFVSTSGGRILRVDPRSAKVVGTIDLAVADGPAGMAFEPTRGLLWIAERGAGQVRAVRPSGAVVHQIQAANGVALKFPADVAVDAAAGLVWVLLESGEGVPMAHAYHSADATWARSALPGGAGAGQIYRGGGIAVDGAGSLYCTDSFAGVVQVVDPAGVSGARLAGYGTGPGQLKLPAGAAFIGNGDLVVANRDNSRLDRFGTGAALPTCPGDSDCDGLPDDWEVKYGLNPNDPSDALLDGDGDGLTNLQELALGTNPTRKDSDGDGVSDGDEVAAGTDPLAGGSQVAFSASGPATSGPGLVSFSSVVQGAVGCTAAWAQVGGPAVTLRGAATFTPGFVARKAATYRLQGVATCGAQASAPVVVETTVLDVAPRADAGRIQVVRPGQRFELDGGFSSDANGDALALAWEEVRGQAVAASLAGAGTMAVAARRPGLLGFQLTATDPAGHAVAAEVPVVVLDRLGRAPTAAVASPLGAHVGEEVTLDARGSFGAGGDTTFQWRQLAGPEVKLVPAGNAAARFSPEAPGRYAFEVSLSTRRGQSAPARAEVFVAAAGGELPVAAPRLGSAPALGEPVVLDGSASAGAGLAFRWKQLSGPAAGLADSDRAMATAVPFAPGAYAFELSVASGQAESLPAVVAFQVAARGSAVPVAVARAAVAVGNHGRRRQGAQVELDGRGSSGARHCRWTQVAGPWGHIEAPGSARTRFEAPAPGSYAFELEVDDGAVRSAPSRVEVTVSAHEHGRDRDGERDDGDDDAGERE